MRKHFETFEKQTPWALSIGPKISVCVFGNSQWEMEQHCRFPRFPVPKLPVPQFFGSSFWILGSQLISFRLLGCQFLSSWRPVPRVFAEDSSVHPLLPCTFALSRFSRRLKSWGMFVRMEGVKCLLTMVGFALRPCSIL